MTNYSAAAQDLSSNLSLNALKRLIEPFRDMKMLIGITCRPEFYDFLIKGAAPTTKNCKSNEAICLYIIKNQKQPVRYWYNNQYKEFREYLKKNT
jgi:hypothetical protein